MRHEAARVSSERRLLLLLQSQRARLAAAALELAEVRQQTAAALDRPELEAAWLAPPAPEEEDAAHVGDEAEVKAEARSELEAQVRREFLGAMAHAM